MKHLKNLFMVISFAFCLASSAQHKNLEAGVHLGIPTGDVENFINIVYGADLTFYFSQEIAEIFDLGITAGYTEFNLDNQGLFVDAVNNDTAFLKLGVAGKLNFQGNVFFNTDLGYAIGLDQVDGGAYFSPKIGYHFDSFLVNLYYTFVRTDTRFPDYASIGVGFSIRL